MFGFSFGTIVKGFFSAIDFAKKLLGFVERRQAKQEGRTERDLEVQQVTTETLVRNDQAGKEIDQMSDAEVDEKFDKL